MRAQVTAIGAGLALGASLGLIIPEGFELMLEGTHAEGQTLGHGMGGLALTLGLLMFLVLENALATDGVASNAAIPTAVAERDEEGANSMLFSDDARRRRASTTARARRGESAATMMIIHAVADGLVVGTSAMSGRQEVTAVVGVAMIAHKIPASFSLGSYLIALNLPKSRVIRLIVAFASSSPIAALAAFCAIGFLPASFSGAAISFLMLFSGGSVLYTACFHSESPPPPPPPPTPSARRPTPRQLCAAMRLASTRASRVPF